MATGRGRVRLSGTSIPPFLAQGPTSEETRGSPLARGCSFSSCSLRKSMTEGCNEFSITFKWIFFYLINHNSRHALLTNGRRCMRHVDSAGRQGLPRSLEGPL